MKNKALHKLKVASPKQLLILAAAMGALFLSRPASAGTAYSLSTLTTGNAWTNTTLWTPAGAPGTTAGIFDDTVALNLGAPGGNWSMNLNTNATIASLTVTNTGAFTVGIAPGTLTTGTLTFAGANPVISASCGSTFTLNGFNLDPSLTGVVVTKAGRTTGTSTAATWQMNNENAATNVFRALSGGGGIVIGNPGTFTFQMITFTPTVPYALSFPSLTRTATSAGQFVFKPRYFNNNMSNTTVSIDNQIAPGSINNLLLDGCLVTLNSGGVISNTSITIGTGSGSGTSNCKLIWNSFNNGGYPVSTFLLGDQSFGGDNHLVFDPGVGGTLNVVNSLTLGNYISTSTARNANTFLDVMSGFLFITNNLVIANSATTNAASIDTSTGAANIYGGTVQVKANVIVGNAGGTGLGKADLNLNGGTLIVGSPIITGNGTNALANNRAIVSLNGGTIQASTNIANLFQLTKANDRIFVKTNGAFFDTYTNTVGIASNLLSDVVAGGGLTKLGTGTLILGGSNTYTGTNILIAGFLSIGNEINWGVGTNAVTFNGGNLQITGTVISNLNSHTVNWPAFNGGFDIANSGNLFTVTNEIGGAGGLRKYGTGTLLLNSSNSFAGGTVLFGGALRANVSSALGAAAGGIYWDFGQSASGDTRLELTGGITLSNALNLRMKTLPATGKAHIVNLSGVNTLAGPLNLTSGGNFNGIESASGLLILNGGGNQDAGGFERPLYLQGAGSGEVDATITDSGGWMSLVKEGVGTWTINAPMDLNKSTTVNAGTLALGAAGALNNSSTITVNTNGILNVAAVSGGFTLGAVTAQTLTGSGSVLGDVLVSSSGTLAGRLTINGHVVNASSATISPGGTGAAATLTISSNLTLNSGNNLSLNLNTLSAVPNANNDLVAVGHQLNVADVTTVNLIFPGGVPLAGTNLLATFGSFAGSLANLSVASPVSGYTYIFSNSATALYVVISSSRATQNLAWAGDGGNNFWDISTSYNWTNLTSGLLDYYANPDNVLFDDRTANTSVNLNSTVAPTSITVTNTQDYTFSDAGGGSIVGNTSLTKSGTGNLTINTVNSFVGPITASGGTITINNAGGLGSGGALSLNGATLTYTGAAVPAGGFVHNVTLGAAGGTIDQQSTSGIFVFLTNQISGAGALTKEGPQQLILGDNGTGTGSNDYSGITYVNNGNLQFRNANALGSTAGKTIVRANGSLTGAGGSTFTNTVLENIDLEGGNLSGGPVNFGGSITIVSNSTFGGGSAFTVSGPIGGAGSLTKVGGGTLTLLNSVATYAGGTVIAGGTLQLGTNGTSGWLGVQPFGVALTNTAGTLTFNRSDVNTFAGDIISTGPINHNGSGTTILAGNISSSGAFNQNSGLTILGGSNEFTAAFNINNGSVRATNSFALGNLGGGTVTISSGTNLGYLELAGNINTPKSLALSQKNNVNSGVGAQAPSISNLSGTNTISGPISLNAGGNYWAINSAAGLLTLTSVTNYANTTFGRPLYLEGAGDGVISTILEDVSTNWLQVVKYGAGTWTISCPATLPQGVKANEGTLVIGGNVNLGINAAMGSTVAGGTLLVNGQLPGTVTVSSGTLGGSGILSNAVTIQASGTLSPGNGGIGTLSFSNTLTLGGKLFIEVNKALAQSNDFAIVSSTLSAIGGTVTVTNLNPGAPLVVGNKFTLFSKPVASGNLLTISGGGTGVAWANNLAVDGSISVIPGVSTNAFAITNTVSGNNLNLSWPADHMGWRLQVQTNSLTTGLSTAWYDWPNSTNLTSVSVPLNPANPSVFFRMIYP